MGDSSDNAVVNKVDATKTATATKTGPMIDRLPYITRHVDETPNIRIENCIGFAQVPLGLAGPLTISGRHQRGTYFAPLATLEATLVASCSRGCKAFQQSGGVQTRALREGMSRAPAFKFASVDDAVAFHTHLPTLEPQLREAAEKTSRHARLVRLTPHIVGSTVHVKFDYACGDAAGQNMSTIATHAACARLLKEQAETLRIADFQLEGQMASDKKLSWGSVGEPRGVQVLAWGVLSDQTCRTVLGVSGERIHAAFLTGTGGAIRNGMVGNNVNAANVVAAMFIACGQDAASVLECGWTHLTTEYKRSTRELSVSLFVPSLAVGTVGGGTAYATQKEALELVGCAGEGAKWALAETVAAFALALEVSTLSAMANDTFSQSHQRMARRAKL